MAGGILSETGNMQRNWRGSIGNTSCTLGSMAYGIPTYCTGDGLTVHQPLAQRKGRKQHGVQDASSGMFRVFEAWLGSTCSPQQKKIADVLATMALSLPKLKSVDERNPQRESEHKWSRTRWTTYGPEEIAFNRVGVSPSNARKKKFWLIWLRSIHYKAKEYWILESDATSTCLLTFKRSTHLFLIIDYL